MGVVKDVDALSVDVIRRCRGGRGGDGAVTVTVKTTDVSGEQLESHAMICTCSFCSEYAAVVAYASLNSN